MTGNPAPAIQLRLPISGGNQRKHRVIVTGAKNINNLGILQISQQRGAVHDPAGPALKIRVGQGFYQSPGQRQMNSPNILIVPQRPVNTIYRKQNFSGFRLVIGQQMIQIARRLVQAEYERMIKGAIRHDSTSSCSRLQRLRGRIPATVAKHNFSND